MATETSSIGDEWEWISNDTAEILRATVESAFTADPRKNWSAEELARWIRDVALVSAKKNVWDHAAALGEYLVNGRALASQPTPIRRLTSPACRMLYMCLIGGGMALDALKMEVQGLSSTFS